MEKSYQPEFHLLGKRKYVHGTSQTHALIEALNAWSIQGIQRVVGAFHEVLYTGGAYWLYSSKSDQIESGKKISTSYIVETIEQQRYYIGFEPKGAKVVQSVSYDEDAIVSHGIIEEDTRSATLVCKPEFHIFNTIVALNKRLHLSVLPRDKDTQWFFGNYDLKWPNLSNRSAKDILEVTVQSIFNNKYTRSTVVLNGEAIGNVSFVRAGVK